MAENDLQIGIVDEAHSSLSAMQNSQSRIGERVAALDERSQSQSRDLEALRRMGHDTNEQMQKFVVMLVGAQSALQAHLASCDRRGKWLMGLGVSSLVAVLGVLGFLLKYTLFK